MNYRIVSIPKGNVYSRFLLIVTSRATNHCYKPQYQKYGIWWTIRDYCYSEKEAMNCIIFHKRTAQATLDIPKSPIDKITIMPVK